MIIIRLQRVGRRNDPAFRVVVTDSKRGPKANYLEMVGSYNPKAGTIELNAERIKLWISNGAQVSDTVHNFLVSKEIIKGKKINVLPKKTAPVKEVPAAAAPPAAPKAEATPEVSEEPAVEEPAAEVAAA